MNCEQCKCGIARVDCPYHRPESPKLEAKYPSSCDFSTATGEELTLIARHFFGVERNGSDDLALRVRCYQKVQNLAAPDGFVYHDPKPIVIDVMIDFKP